MSESALWSRVREAVRGSGHWVRVENAAEVGTPDVNYCTWGCEGWIELKHVPAVPLRATTPIEVGLTIEQRNWIIERDARGGRAFILVQIDRELFLFNARSAYTLWTGAPLGTLRMIALWNLSDGWERFLNEVVR